MARSHVRASVVLLLASCALAACDSRRPSPAPVSSETLSADSGTGPAALSPAPSAPADPATTPPTLAGSPAQAPATSAPPAFVVVAPPAPLAQGAGAAPPVGGGVVGGAGGGGGPGGGVIVSVTPTPGGHEQGLLICGRVQRLVRDRPGSPNTSGIMIVGGTTIVLPGNLLFDLPAARLSLEELFDMAPEPFHTRGVSGVALEDGPPANDWVATIVANRTGGVVTAGIVGLAKRRETLDGVVTSFDPTVGELRLNEIAGVCSGTRVRLNDPTSVCSIQSAVLAAGPGTNGSADRRASLDRRNVTVTAVTGYPMRIPAVDPELGDDPFAPRANRAPAIDAAVGEQQQFFPALPYLQAPVLVGDHVIATGTFEVDPGPDGKLGTLDDVAFLSADTLLDVCFLFTAPQDPCYVRVENASWVGPPFPLRRVDLVVAGNCTDPTAQISLEAVRHDPTTTAEHLELLGTTFSRPGDGGLLLPLGRFQFQLSVDLGGGGGFSPPAPGADLLTLARDVEVTASNQHGVGAGERFLNRGAYTSPVQVLFLDPELNPRLLGQAWDLRNIPWLVDGEGTARSSGPLVPFPQSESRPDARTKTVRDGQLQSRVALGLPVLP